ncbi:TPA: DUF262 domain-containing protein [Escherichia coli]|nr:DUF262 domain-containing protein [Escherichia coli]ELS7768942.1 DUF262 domain-containing protein [Escherichia coli]HCO7756568.1 DUF262 domain-containing protein [Escherichia coli]HDU5214000.1 DUF262 domain-containing protein [Escherichia coli]HDU5700129.1 DUF262 domain-containing protein [Escherichia coli]
MQPEDYEEKQYEDEPESYPIDEFQLTTTPNDFNIITIISFIKSKVFKIPNFQRHYVWDIKRASKLIESLLIGLPIPQIFLYEQDKNEFLVIDGQQRLMTLYYFVNGVFPRKEKRSELRKIFEDNGNIPENILHNDEYFTKFNLKLDGLSDTQKNKFNGKNYETLNEFQTTLNLATIRNMVIKPVAQDSEDGAMFEIFNRLNSGGMNLSPQEIRMSLYHSDFLSNLVSLNENKTWRKILSKNVVDMRLSDIEAILRTFAMSLFTSQYKSSVSGFLNNFSNYAKNYDTKDITLFSNIWNKFMDSVDGIDEINFRTGGNRMSITLFESIFYAATYDSFKDKDLKIRQVTVNYIDKLKNDPEFLTFSTDKTTRREHVIGRLERARTILEGM